MANMSDIQEAKLYMRIDEPDDDALVGSLYAAAEEYMRNAGILEDRGSYLYKLALWGLMLHWYEHPQALADGQQIPEGTRIIINQLKFAPTALCSCFDETRGDGILWQQNP